MALVGAWTCRGLGGEQRKCTHVAAMDTLPAAVACKARTRALHPPSRRLRAAQPTAACAIVREAQPAAGRRRREQQGRRATRCAPLRTHAPDQAPKTPSVHKLCKAPTPALQFATLFVALQRSDGSRVLFGSAGSLFAMQPATEEDDGGDRKGVSSDAHWTRAAGPHCAQQAATCSWHWLAPPAAAPARARACPHSLAVVRLHALFQA